MMLNVMKKTAVKGTECTRECGEGFCCFSAHEPDGVWSLGDEGLVGSPELHVTNVTKNKG